MIFDENKATPPPPEKPVKEMPNRVKRAMELVAKEIPVSVVARSIHADPGTVRAWIQQYEPAKLDTKMMLKSVGGAQAELAAKYLKELHRRYDEGMAMPDQTLLVGMGIATQRSLEVEKMEPDKPDVDWDSLKD